MLHPAFAQQAVLDEKMPLIDRPPGAGEGRADDDLPRLERVGERVCHGTDIAFSRGIEGRAVFEENLRAALGAQPVKRRQRLGHGLVHGDRPGLEGHDPGLDIARGRA